MRKAKGQGRRTAITTSFLAPVGGWVKNQNIAKPDARQPQGAERLVNILPTATGAELRGGSDVYATLGDADSDVQALMVYNSGLNEKLFASTADAIYDITNVVDAETSPDEAVSGLTGGRWSAVQFATTGGIYLVAVNGSDTMRLFDGDLWIELEASDLYQIDYDAEAGAFTVGETLTGGTSGATGEIVAVKDNGATGFVIVKDVSGTFQNDENITDGATGDATQDGTATKVFNAITGIATSSLSYGWTYKSRLFFVEKDSLNAWYAAIDNVGGALTKFPLAGVFPQGGSLMFGASWSLDTGADGGLSAQCVFVSTEGEVAVYQGTDPSSNFSLVGVYRIGQPLGPNAWHRAGGDLVISTDIGHVPLSQAINRDLAALSPASISYPIETAWNEAVAERLTRDWQDIVWPERQMVIVALPTGDGQIPTMYVANARTGRWCEFVGWDAKSIIVFQGRLLWGSSEGRVVEGYVTGQDQGATYTGIYVPLFEDLRTPASLKTPKLARPVLRSNATVRPTISMQYDYKVELPPAPNAAAIGSSDVWGAAVWGTSVWGGNESSVIQQDWVSVSGEGYSISPALQFTSGSVAPLSTEIVRIDVTYDLGDIVS
jgi:hypothetical protein